MDDVTLICHKCGTRPIRARPGVPDERGITIIWCMDCAVTESVLKAGDYDPEPAGFVEFLKLGEGGPTS